MEPWGFEPQILPCHGSVIPFHYGPARKTADGETLAGWGEVSSKGRLAPAGPRVALKSALHALGACEELVVGGG